MTGRILIIIPSELLLYTVLATGEIIRGSEKKILIPDWKIGSALCNQTKIGNPCALDDFESECMWISDFWCDASFSLYEGSKLTNWFIEMRLIIEKAIEEMSTATSLAMEPWHLTYLLWNETLPIIGTVYSFFTADCILCKFLRRNGIYLYRQCTLV